MAVKDILLESDYDLSIKDGDFFVNDSDQQHIELIIRTTVGSWKQFPLLGVGIDYYLASAGLEQTLKSNITVQLISDSYAVTDLIFDITIDKFEVSTNANRIKQTS